MLALDDRWIWDFWLADDGERHHVFFLQAPTSLGDPDLRHDNASVYSMRLVQRRDGSWVALGFIDSVDGRFVGALSDPVPVPFG